MSYRQGHPSNPDAAIDLVESNRDPFENAQPELLQLAHAEHEFSAVQHTVRNNSSAELTRRWATEGDFNRYWNIEKARAASRTQIETELLGSKRQIELASWKEPFDVAVLTFSLPPVHFTVSTLNLSQQEVVDCLRSLSVLRDDEASLALHQEDIAETRKLLRPDR